MSARHRAAEALLGTAGLAIVAGVVLALLSACEAHGAPMPLPTTIERFDDTTIDPAGHATVRFTVPEGQVALVLGSDDLAHWVLVSELPATARDVSVCLPLRVARRFVRVLAFATPEERAAWLARPDAPPPAGTLPEPAALFRGFVEIPPTTTETPAEVRAATAVPSAGKISAPAPRNPRRK